MQAGQLRHKIALQSPTEVSDGLGGVTVTWSTQHKCYAEIDPPKGRQFFVAGQKQNEVVQRIRIRYYSSVTPEWRVRFGTRYFDIESIIDPDERNIEQIMMCTEQVATT